MPQKYKTKRSDSIPSGLLPNNAPSEVKIQELLASGKNKVALDFAKDFHKAHGTAASEALLIQAYTARIQALLKQDLALEAGALIELVRQRYPSAAPSLAEIEAVAAARSGALDPLLGRLLDPGLAPEVRASIELAIQQELYDLGAIADSAVLPGEHPLRTAACALRKAFSAVTSGRVHDDDIALQEVWHRSPLAPWKVLVRAIAAFYRGENEICRLALDAIKPQSAPGRAVPALRAMLENNTDAALTPAANHLAASIAGGTPKLRSALESLERAFDGDDESRIAKAIGTAMQECRRTAPDKIEWLKQHFVVRSMMNGMDPEDVFRPINGPIAPDAGFFRLLARGMEMVGETHCMEVACSSWDTFREMAVADNWFKANGPEVATLYLHMAGNLDKLDPEDLRRLQRVLKSPANPEGGNAYYFHPDKLYERACALDPHAEAFAQWMESALRRSETQAQRVAEAWHKVCPNEIKPVLHLMETSAGRGNFPTALGYLAKAERIDAVNPLVRRARFRFLAGNAVRQIQKNDHRAANETISQMAALPQAQQGDRPAFLWALRYMTSTLRNNDAEAAMHREATVNLLESGVGASLLIYGVAAACKRNALEKLSPPTRLAPRDRAELPATLARLRTLAEDVQIKFDIPSNWINATAKQFLKDRDSLDVRQLRALGEAAMSAGHVELAYGISAAGLERGGATAAAFLLLRAQCLPSAQFERRAVCGAAAAELARQQRDMEIVQEAVALSKEVFGLSGVILTLAQARQVLDRERLACNFSKDHKRGPDYRDVLPKSECPCPECRRARGEAGPFEDLSDEEFDEEDGRFEDDFDPFVLPPGMPPGLAGMIGELMQEAMDRGETPDQFLDRIVKGVLPPPRGGKKKGQRK